MREAGERTAAFDALYTEQAANPLIDTIEPVRIAEEPLVYSGSAFCTVNSRPRTFVLKVLSKCSSLISPRVPNSYIPAFTANTSDAPCLRLDLCKDAVEVGEASGIALDRRGIAADHGDCLIQLGLVAIGNKTRARLLARNASQYQGQCRSCRR